MKTNFIKQILPLAAFGVALAGAFSTNAMNSRANTAAPIQGFTQLNEDATECEQHDVCSTINNGQVCRVGLVPSGARLWGKNDNQECKRVVYMP